ncbi:MAG TPA: hypothetical protein VG389_01445 [Myxococcota bacterium]|jgi:hypothetical protein|nr:hypothetical protein [Myxococcota bacterium]
MTRLRTVAVRARRGAAAAAAVAAAAAAAGLAAGCGPKCEPPAGADVCTPAEPTCLAEAPQICPRLAPVSFCNQEVGGGGYMFTLEIDNYGTDALSIAALRLVGDDRCAFNSLEVDPPVGSTVASEQALLVRFVYEPPDIGPDSAWLEIDSNAENFPTLVVPLCGNGAVSTDWTMNCDCPESWTAGLPEVMCP